MCPATSSLSIFLKKQNKRKNQKTAGEPGNKLVITQTSKHTEIQKGSWGVGGARSGRCTHILFAEFCALSCGCAFHVTCQLLATGRCSIFDVFISGCIPLPLELQ